MKTDKKVSLVCKSCKEGPVFASLPKDALMALEHIKAHFCLPPNSVIFLEDQPATGLYMLCEGTVMLRVSSSEGKVLNLRLAGQGELLGLAEAMLMARYTFAATTVSHCRLAFIRSHDLSSFLVDYPQAYRSLSEELLSEINILCQRLRASLAHAPNKLASFLVSWTLGNKGHERGYPILLTQKQIADFIGTSRETVTRTLTEFRRQNLVIQKGKTMVIPDLQALRLLAEP